MNWPFEQSQCSPDGSPLSGPPPLLQRSLSLWSPLEVDLLTKRVRLAFFPSQEGFLKKPANKAAGLDK